MKNSNDTIGDRTRDLPACSAVPQPTAPQRTPNNDSRCSNYQQLQPSQHYDWEASELCWVSRKIATENGQHYPLERALHKNKLHGNIDFYTSCTVARKSLVQYSNQMHIMYKVLPTTGHEGLEGEQIYSSTLPSTSALDGGWVVNATPRPLYPRERPGTHCTGGWVGPRACLDGCGKSRPHWDSIPGPSSP